mmetsp:Transcript_10618/g.25417  ORF Transcript_10618/g.25417 Transcript_10618/m.25417 type:complete len:209 (-) Transcript_10618:450-1076(-)
MWQAPLAQTATARLHEHHRARVRVALARKRCPEEVRQGNGNLDLSHSRAPLASSLLDVARHRSEPGFRGHRGRHGGHAMGAHVGCKQRAHPRVHDAKRGRGIVHVYHEERQVERPLAAVARRPPAADRLGRRASGGSDDEPCGDEPCGACGERRHALCRIGYSWCAMGLGGATGLSGPAGLAPSFREGTDSKGSATARAQAVSLFNIV